MKMYSGARTIDGIQVTVDGQPLDERVDIHQFTDGGFEWSYEGDAPGSWRWHCGQTISTTTNRHWLFAVDLLDR